MGDCTHQMEWMIFGDFVYITFFTYKLSPFIYFNMARLDHGRQLIFTRNQNEQTKSPEGQWTVPGIMKWSLESTNACKKPIALHGITAFGWFVQI